MPLSGRDISMSFAVRAGKRNPLPATVRRSKMAGILLDKEIVHLYDNRTTE
jgi:hypothetical protein